MKIGIQGGKGSFNEEALLEHIKRNTFSDIHIEYLYTTENVLKSLEEGIIDQGQFAVHNTLGGLVDESLHAMGRYRFGILDKYSIQISHFLMAHPQVEVSEITTIMTHPQVLAQCRKNLSQKYPQLHQTSGAGEQVDHALVAKLISEGEIPRNVATIGSKVLSQIYGLKIIEQHLEDNPSNTTTFLLVSR